MPAGTLTLVPTPIGNLADITFRAVEVLKNADLIACEDTRHSRVLFDHYGIKKPLLSYHDFSERRRAPELIEKLKSGLNVAVVSDAGTPGLADPGFRLVRLAVEEGIRVEALPGPSALLPALVASGLPTDRFVFEGFLPVKSGQRKNRLAELNGQDRTVVFYESPHRILKTLQAMQETLGDVPVVVARELSKKFEEIRRGPLSGHVSHFQKQKPLGEFVVLFHPSEK